MAQYLIVPKRLARALPWLAKGLQWLEYIALRGSFALLRWLPLGAANRLSAGAFRLLGLLSNKRAKVEANLRTAFPERSAGEIRQLSRQTFGNLGLAVVELVKMPMLRDEWQARFTLDIGPASHAHLASGRPAVFVTAHVGPWQVSPTPITRRYLSQPILMVYTPESNPLLNRLMVPLRRGQGVDLVSSRDGARPLLKALLAGQSVGLAADTRVQTGKLVPFFGADALSTTAPARLSLKTGAPMIPAYAVRLRPGHFKVVVEEPVVSALAPDAPEEERAIDMTRQMNARFAAWISAAPAQWMCLKRRWPKPHRL